MSDLPAPADEMRRDMLPERAIPAGARPLGVKAKPIIRLGLGVKHPEKGYPIKTDYLTVRGDDRAVTKFRQRYGDKPKAVEIMVPASLRDALTIRYQAFVGAGGDDPDGGRILAYGHTNFALEDYMGGPDTLTVFTSDGEVVEEEIDGLEGPRARELGLTLTTTLRFGIPAVLGWGSFAEVSSQSKESADNLWFKLREIYSAFGARAPLAVKPLLVLKPSSAMTTFEKDGRRRWGKVKIFVLDIVLPETLDDMIERLRTRQEQMLPAGVSAAEAMYGRRALPAGEDTPPVAGDGGGAPAAGQQAEPSDDLSPDAPSGGSAPGSEAEVEPELEFGEVEEAQFEIPAEVVDAAGLAEIPRGDYQGRTVADVAGLGEKGESWLWYALRRPDGFYPEGFSSALHVFVEHRLPELWQRFEEWKAGQS